MERQRSRKWMSEESCVDSEANIQELDVGGTARVSRGKVLEIDVGGSFESKGQLEFREIDVGGSPFFSTAYPFLSYHRILQQLFYRQDFLHQIPEEAAHQQQYSCFYFF